MDKHSRKNGINMKRKVTKKSREKRAIEHQNIRKEYIDRKKRPKANVLGQPVVLLATFVIKNCITTSVLPVFECTVQFNENHQLFQFARFVNKKSSNLVWK